MVMTQSGPTVFELPLYAAPIERGVRPVVVTRGIRLADDWLAARRVVAREHPWIDRAEKRWRRMRHMWLQCQMPVTKSNAVSSLRAALSLEEVFERWTRRVPRLDTGVVHIAFDPSSWQRDDTDGALSISGKLTMPWLVRPIPVTASAHVWSSTRTDLVLVPGGRRRRYPRRWFLAAFAALDELRQQLVRPTG